MKPLFEHIGLTFAIAMLTMLLPACGSDSPDIVPDDQAGQSAILDIRANILDASRTPLAGDIESMHSLRIVIVRPNGSVEHNYSVNFDTPVEQYERRFFVVMGETKKVYLIANEESVASCFDDATGRQPGSLSVLLRSYTRGSTGFEDFIGNLAFEPDYSQPIPMTSRYDFEVPATSGDEVITKSMYVIRDAVKFSFKFVNNRIDGRQTVNNLSISKVADKCWLMPHLNETASLFGGRFWIDWFKDAIDESNRYPDDVTLADRRGWIKEYDIPTRADNTVVYTSTEPFSIPGPTVKQGVVTKPGELTLADYCYLPESKNLLAASDRYGDQGYDLTLSFEGWDDPFTLRLPNLRALFRNTHVVVTITLGQEDNRPSFVVDVMPYGVVDLEPTFGIDPD